MKITMKVIKAALGGWYGDDHPQDEFYGNPEKSAMRAALKAAVKEAEKE